MLNRIAKVTEGGTFEEFVLQSATELGFLKLSAEVSNEDAGPNETYAQAIERVKAEKEKIRSMPEEEAATKAKKEYMSALELLKEVAVGKQKGKDKLEEMLAQVNLYIAPTAKHENFKERMVKDIEDSISIEHDVDSLNKEIKDITEKGPISGQEWKRQHLNDLSRSIAYFTEQNRKDILKSKNDALWGQQLKASLENPPVPA